MKEVRKPPFKPVAGEKEAGYIVIEEVASAEMWRMKTGRESGMLPWPSQVKVSSRIPNAAGEAVCDERLRSEAAFTSTERGRKTGPCLVQCTARIMTTY